MRLAPVVLSGYPDAAAAERMAAESSRTTHHAAECLDACRLLARVLHRALEGRAKEEVALVGRGDFTGEPRIEAIARGSFHGEAGIPGRWLDKLVMRKEIGEMAAQLARRAARD